MTKTTSKGTKRSAGENKSIYSNRVTVRVSKELTTEEWEQVLSHTVTCVELLKESERVVSMARNSLKAVKRWYALVAYKSMIKNIEGGTNRSLIGNIEESELYEVVAQWLEDVGGILEGHYMALDMGIIPSPEEENEKTA